MCWRLGLGLNLNLNLNLNAPAADDTAAHRP